MTNDPISSRGKIEVVESRNAIHEMKHLARGDKLRSTIFVGTTKHEQAEIDRLEGQQTRCVRERNTVKA